MVLEQWLLNAGRVVQTIVLSAIAIPALSCALSGKLVSVATSYLLGQVAAALILCHWYGEGFFSNSAKKPNVKKVKFAC